VTAGVMAGAASNTAVEEAVDVAVGSLMWHERMPWNRLRRVLRDTLRDTLHAHSTDTAPHYDTLPRTKAALVELLQQHAPAARVEGWMGRSSSPNLGAQPRRR
jgi:hypothetical protein